MKRKISKILGVGLTLTILCSLVVATAPVAVAASPGALVYEAVATPNTTGSVLVAAGVEANLLVATPDGTTLFAMDNVAGKLYKSTTGGKTWSAAETVATATLTNLTLVDIAVSPNYAVDSSIVAATTTAVYYSSDGGKTFTSVAPTDLATKLETGDITSVDICNHYSNGVLNLLVGCTDAGADAVSNVIRFPLGTWSWLAVGTLGNTGGVTANVIEVAFSPAHLSDAQIVAVYTDGTNTVLASQFGTVDWGINIAAKQITAGTATDAVLAFGDDYVGTTNQTILVGTTGATVDDAFRVSNLYLGATAATIAVKALNVAAAGDDIQSIDISGPIATSNVIIGLAAAVANPNIYRCANITATTPTITASTKAPTGVGAAVLWVGDTAYAGTTGTDSAVSTSVDNGAKWNQISMINVSALAGMSITSTAVIDSKTIFVLMANAAGAPYKEKSLFKTADGGSSWERVYCADDLGMLMASPAYASDSTLYIADDTNTLLYKSVDGGMSFTALGITAKATSLAVVNTDTYFYGDASGKVYKSGRWASASAGAASITSIALSAGYATDSTLMVGNDVGAVYQSTDDGVTFSRVGTSGPGGTGDTMYVAYGPDGRIYAGSSNVAAGTQGVWRWDPATATVAAAWKGIKTGTTVLVRGLVVTAKGELYAADNTAGVGIHRTIDSTATTPTFQAMGGTAIPFVMPAAAQLGSLEVKAGSSYAIATGMADGTLPTTAYGYTSRLVTVTDTLGIGIAPAMSSPAWKNDQYGETIPTLTTDKTAALKWGIVTGATKYTYQCSTSSAFTSPITAEVGTTSATASGLTGGTLYYVRVRVTAPLNSEWSSIKLTKSSAFPAEKTLILEWKFVTAMTAWTTGLSAPAVGAIGTVIEPLFVWEAISGATGYEFQISEQPDMTLPEWVEIVNQNYCTVETPLSYSTVYYWQVRAIKVISGDAVSRGAWSSVSIFSTMDEPEEALPPVEITAAPKLPDIKIEVPVQSPVIPDYLLYIVIGVGAALVIAVIVLIVRTRRVV